jgi:hypothetical protein
VCGIAGAIASGGPVVKRRGYRLPYT